MHARGSVNITSYLDPADEGANWRDGQTDFDEVLAMLASCRVCKLAADIDDSIQRKATKIRPPRS